MDRKLTSKVQEDWCSLSRQLAMQGEEMGDWEIMSELPKKGFCLKVRGLVVLCPGKYRALKEDE